MEFIVLLLQLQLQLARRCVRRIVAASRSTIDIENGSTFNGGWLPHFGMIADDGS